MQTDGSPDFATTLPPPHTPARRAPWESPYVWGFFLLVGAAVLSRQYFGAISYWYDEGFYLFNLFRRPFAALIGAVDCRVAAPPLYLWMERAVYLVLGPSELAMRLPSFLAGLAALFLMAPLARRLMGGPVWPWALAFCALSSHFVQHACEVHPYAFDMLGCEAVLMAACLYVTLEGRFRAKAGAAAVLFAAALVLPWFSFPSVYSLGAAGLALLIHALRRRSPRDLMVCVAFGGLTVLSGAAMWYCHARHLYYGGIQDEWASGFPKHYTPVGVLVWTLNTPVEIGNYATPAMGVPLLVLGLIGAWALARRSPPLAVLAAGPILLGMGAGFLRRYPMDDRLLMYAGPCIWLLGAAGIGAILERLHGRWKWAAVALFAVMLAPGALETAKQIATVRPRGDWRTAFTYVNQHKTPGDKIWVAFPQVYQAYYGDPPDFLGVVPESTMERQALQGRMWVVTMAHHPVSTKLIEQLEKQGCRRLDLHTVDRDRLDVYLYTPPAGGDGG